MSACDESQLADAEARLGVALPSSLRSLYLTDDGRFRADGEWWVVWPLSRLVDDNLCAWHDGSLDESLVAFGDDGAGDPFCMRVRDDGRVARWSIIDSAVVAEMSFDMFESDWLSN